MIFQRVISKLGKFKLLQRPEFLQYFHSARVFLKTRNCLRNNLVIKPFATIGFVAVSTINESNYSKNYEALINKVDALFDNKEFQTAYDILIEYEDKGNAEILWRLSQNLYYISKTASQEEAKKMIFKAYDLITTALKIDSNNWAVHKWIAILIDSKTNYEGVREKMKMVEVIKSHMDKASKLNPKDATTLHMIGHWFYAISDLPWYQKKIVAAVFGKVPDASYEDALKYLLSAEQLEPMFLSLNLLLLGKTYLKLNQKDEAIKYLRKAEEFSGSSVDDLNAKMEAHKILETL